MYVQMQQIPPCIKSMKSTLAMTAPAVVNCNVAEFC